MSEIEGLGAAWEEEDGDEDEGEEEGDGRGGREWEERQHRRLASFPGVRRGGGRRKRRYEREIVLQWPREGEGGGERGEDGT